MTDITDITGWPYDVAGTDVTMWIPHICFLRTKRTLNQGLHLTYLYWERIESYKFGSDGEECRDAAVSVSTGVPGKCQKQNCHQRNTAWKPLQESLGAERGPATGRLWCPPCLFWPLLEGVQSGGATNCRIKGNHHCNNKHAACTGEPLTYI